MHSEKEKLKNDIEELRVISQKLQMDVGKVNEEKTLLSAIVKNTQGNNLYLDITLITVIIIRGEQGLEHSYGKDHKRL